MPELPEVELGRKIAERAVVGRTIERLECADDDIVYDGVEPAAVCRALRGARVDAVARLGKHLWFELDRRPWPLFHFGMTGAFRVPGETPLRLESSPKELDAVWPPKFVKIRMWLDDGGELVMTNARRLGRIRLRNDPRNEPPISDLGFDPLLAMPSAAEFEALLARRKGVLKGLLLNQGFAAGVGNWIADEVLYQAKIDPRRRANSLSPAECLLLRTKLGSVIGKAVDVDADKDRLPTSWLFHYRWGKNQDAVTPAGEKIQIDTIAGRSTAWVPALQS